MPHSWWYIQVLVRVDEHRSIPKHSVPTRNELFFKDVKEVLHESNDV